MRAACPRCRQESLLHLSAKDWNRRITDETFDYYRCAACGIVFLSPVPRDIGKYYPSDYYGIPSSVADLAAAAQFERYKIELVRRFATGGRLLEIGPAYGAFTWLAKQAGFDAFAIEMSEACCRFMNEVAGIHAVHSLDIDAALRAAGQCDVIALWHVIEHLPDPWATLALLAERLNSGGVLVIAAPNPQAFQFRLMGRYWTHLDAPRHLHLIPAATLAAHAQGLGLDSVLSTTRDTGSLGWNDFGWGMTFANASGNWYLKRGFRLLGKMVGKLFIPVDSAEGRGSAYTAIFRKARQA
jgi:2-polyprenyl-3-methyl-5-hydroxy-6-metoxy-1,4-benzoquinol methylase